MSCLRFSIVLVLILATSGAFAAPVLSVDNPSYEVSIQGAGVIVSHVFAIKNTGDQTLRIARVEPSCVCTSAILTKTELGPGDAATLTVSVDTAGFEGQVVRTVALDSNDSANPRMMLVISITNKSAAKAMVPAINVHDFQKRFYVLVDVRTPEEFASGHLLGAVNIPLSELQTNLSAWTPRLPKDVPIVLQCKAGVRSTQATQILLQAGFTNVLNLNGGITDWTNSFGSRYLFGF